MFSGISQLFPLFLDVYLRNVGVIFLVNIE